MTEIRIPEPELVDIQKLKVDGQNPNRMVEHQLEALKKSIQRWGFIVPVITNKDLLIADGEQRYTAANALEMKQVPVIRLPVKDVDRRLLRQVMNKLRGEHDSLLDAAQKPVELIKQLIEPCTPPNSVIVDPFAGSGSTLMATDQLHRICHLIELDPGSCQITIDRWESFTKRKANKLE